MAKLTTIRRIKEEQDRGDITKEEAIDKLKKFCFVDGCDNKDTCEGCFNCPAHCECT